MDEAQFDPLHDDETYTPVTYMALYGVSYEDDLQADSVGLNRQVATYLRDDLNLPPSVSTFGATPEEMAKEVIRSCDGDEDAIQEVISLVEGWLE